MSSNSPGISMQSSRKELSVFKRLAQLFRVQSAMLTFIGPHVAGAGLAGNSRREQHHWCESHEELDKLRCRGGREMLGYLEADRQVKGGAEMKRGAVRQVRGQERILRNPERSPIDVGAVNP